MIIESPLSSSFNRNASDPRISKFIFIRATVEPKWTGASRNGPLSGDRPVVSCARLAHEGFMLG